MHDLDEAVLNTCLWYTARLLHPICGDACSDGLSEDSGSDNWDGASSRSIADHIDRLLGGAKQVSLDLYAPLTSIFSLLPAGTKSLYCIDPLPGSVPFAQANEAVNREERKARLTQFQDHLPKLRDKVTFLDDLLELSDTYLSTVPSGNDRIRRCLPLADRLQYGVCLCACLGAYHRQTGVLVPSTAETLFHEKNLFLFSCDISGIQNFIYTVSGKGALKSLRSRSFYLDFLLKHTMYGILRRLGLSIAHIAYAGGGRGYLLLPNTPHTRQVVETAVKQVNFWLLDHFDISLYLASGGVECTISDLFHPQGDGYRTVFSKLAENISENKANRYQAEDIRRLNGRPIGNRERECRICARSDRELDAEDVCPFCRAFIAISPFLLDDNRMPTVLQRPPSDDLPFVELPSIDGGTDFLCFPTAQQVSELRDEDIVQMYHTGSKGPGLRYEIGGYAYMENGETAAFEKLAESSEGIRRIAVLRADVDNLGLTFMTGFDAARAEGFAPFLLTAALSKQLSLFFRRYLRSILQGASCGEEPFRLVAHPAATRKLVVVYAGGDDMFLAGAWNDVVEAAVDIRSGFQKFTGGALSLSAGIGLFEPKYPISAMAEETSRLEEAAKQLDKRKDAAALFGISVRDGSDGYYHSVASHCYHWDDLLRYVVEGKLRPLQRYFETARILENAGGHAFLYRLQSYVAQTQEHPDERINIARFAYLLARLEPTAQDPAVQEAYRLFSDQMYAWILNAEDRQQLLSAVTLYIYLTRKEEWE